MKTRMAIKLGVLGVLIVAVGYWLRGHDILIAMALALLFLVVLAKVVFALIFRRGVGSPPGGQVGAPSAWRPAAGIVSCGRGEALRRSVEEISLRN